MRTLPWFGRASRAEWGVTQRGSVRVRFGLALVLCVAVLVAGCAPGVSHSRLQAEPVLAPLPGAVELGQEERTASYTLLGEVSGYVRIYYATPADHEALVEHYLQEHGSYAFSVNDRHGSRSGSGRATVLTATRDGVRVSVHVDSVPSVGPDGPSLRPLPPEADAVASVTVQSP